MVKTLKKKHGTSCSTAARDDPPSFSLKFLPFPTKTTAKIVTFSDVLRPFRSNLTTPRRFFFFFFFVFFLSVNGKTSEKMLYCYSLKLYRLTTKKSQRRVMVCLGLYA